MKNIIIMLLLFTGLFSAQDYRKQAEMAAKDQKVPAKDLGKFIDSYSTMLRKINDMSVTSALPPITTDVCDDGGFETKDFSNWGWTMAVNRKTGSNIIPFSTQTATGTTFNHATSFSYTSTSTANLKWEITSVGNDPIFPALSMVHSGNRALRLGREETGGIMPNCGAESIQKTFNITSSNSTLTFWYAVVLQDPTTITSTTHTKSESPAFGVRIHEGSVVNYVPFLPALGSFPTNPLNSVNHPFWTSKNDPNGSNEQIRMRPWTCAKIDLKQYIGKTITIEFIVNDCTHGGHFGYAYLDDICLGCEGSDMGDASIKGMTKDCGADAIVNGSYTLPHSSTITGSLVFLQATHYQNGAPVGTTITVPTSNINTTAKTFNFPMSLFGAVPAGNYDIVITGNFLFAGTSLSTTSSINGFVSGINNDWKTDCPPTDINCCNNKFQVVTPMPVPPSYPFKGGTYGVEDFKVTIPNDVPLTEIKVNVESFEWISPQEDCKHCQNKQATLGSIFGVRTIGTGSNTMTLTTQPYGNGNNLNNNNSELIWSNPTGANLTTADKFTLIYLLPAEKDLTCCVTKAKICVKISWRDINCNYCEVYTCSDVELKNPKDLRPGQTLPDLLTLYLNSRNVFSNGHADGL